MGDSSWLGSIPSTLFDNTYSVQCPNMCLHRMLLTILAETAESLDFATRRWQFYRFSCVFINGVDPHTTSPTRLSIKQLLVSTHVLHFCACHVCSAQCRILYK